ncbi:hypothetical protein FCE95_13380 [Luteimonas gilva]|uniref:Uncharacterized protein n=1 Tax=Luteimonas gilva TaxID=2572684 RepID=A0A4V5ZPZ4_9GAMM|nr:hypothetical protein [Luteimonas gilva]TKR31053.1 hypothetical protein FCE95_13380 [Luteimonas gilva]
MRYLLLLTLCAIPQAYAQDALPVPARADFVKRDCVPAMTRQLGNDAAAATFAHAACECSYRLLSDRQTMTREQFDAAGTVCRAEFEQDNAAFVRKYAE